MSKLKSDILKVALNPKLAVTARAQALKILALIEYQELVLKADEN